MGHLEQKNAYLNQVIEELKADQHEKATVINRLMADRREADVECRQLHEANSYLRLQVDRRTEESEQARGALIEVREMAEILEATVKHLNDQKKRLEKELQEVRDCNRMLVAKQAEEACEDAVEGQKAKNLKAALTAFIGEEIKGTGGPF